ncbi:MAG: hypothetical protein EP298_03780 [Gammaproteobacteria bacterium]|nr:MAG: hypothetical protein EP298_03780 [Gammaproteobacteria bacterium]UTW43750.1 hypothetical protein KFE69_06585 [bacterium SCSIO 12844]
MPTSLNFSEVSRLQYAFSYIKQYGLCAPDENVYNYFRFSDQVHHRISNFFFVSYDMASSDLTRENLSQYVSLGVPFGGSEIYKKPDKIFINHAIDTIADQESDRRNNLFLGLGLKTSADRLIILSKVLEKLYQLQNEESPSEQLLALINVCNVLARDERNQYSSRQTNNFKSLLKIVRDDLLVALGDMSVMELRKTYAQTAENAFNFTDRVAQQLRHKYNFQSEEFSEFWQLLKNSYRVEVAEGSEKITTKIQQVKDALNGMANALEDERRLASSIYKDYPELSWWDVYWHINEDQRDVWNQLKNRMLKQGNDTSHVSICQQLDEYIIDLKNDIKQINLYLNIIEAMPKVKIAQSLEERLKPISDVIEDIKVHGNIPDELQEEPWLNPSSPDNPFFQAFNSAESDQPYNLNA